LTGSHGASNEPGREVNLGSIIALLVTIAAILYAGVVPVDLHPRNEVRWLDPGPGLEFDGRGIAYSDGPLVWEPGAEAGEVSVELWIRPSREPDDRLGQIFSFFDGDAVEPLLIAQWKSGLVIRNRLPESDAGRRYRELGSLGLLFRGHPLMIALTSGPAGTVLYLDGKESEHRSNIPIIGVEEGFGGRLVLGNSASGTTAWHGELLGIAIYRRTLTAENVASHHAAARAGGVASLAGVAGLAALYPFDERSGESAESSGGSGPALRVPLEFRRLRMPVLQLPNLRERSVDSYGRDALLNFIGFAPLGFFLVAVMCRRGRLAGRSVALGVVAFGFFLSLAIELHQVQLPERVSSSTDLLWNTLGTAFGVWLSLHGPLAIRGTQDPV
jgi:VanZ family protein